MKIGILGVGTFGKVLLEYFEKIGHTALRDTARGAEMIFVATPSQAVLRALHKEKEHIHSQPIVVCSKGFGEDGRLISENLKGKFENVFFLYGPTLAEELGEGKLTAMVLAGGQGKEKIKKEIESENFHIELSEDVIGVEIGASMKNVMTIFLGLAEGQGYGQNALAYFFTRGVEEMQRIGLALGAQSETFLGLTSVGDLCLLSRNRRLGIELGRGKKLDEIIREMNYTPQGIANLKDAKKLTEAMHLDAPIVDFLYGIIFENKAKENNLGNIFPR